MKRFTKRIEDFSCEHCGYAVQGRGYTNHCPRCLWSKHVDVNPGDRACDCLGLMQPVALEGRLSKRMLVLRCEKCGILKRNKLSPEDDFEALLDLTISSQGVNICE